VTDGSGIALFTNLTEAYYNITVRADQHGSFGTTFLVAADRTNDIVAFLSRQMVSYNWIVIPTQIPDRYDFQLQPIFQSLVPWPVITIDPGAINLCDFT